VHTFVVQVTSAERDRLKQLQGQLNIVTDRELLVTGVAVLEWIVKERTRGSIVAAINETSGTYKELILPAWDTNL
jgi:hypothetical protein